MDPSQIQIQIHVLALEEVVMTDYSEALNSSRKE